MYSTKTVSSQTTSPWIPLDDNQAAFSATVAVEVSGTLTYTVEFTLDNVQDPAVTPVAFPIGLVGETTSNTTFIKSPVKAIRLNVTSFTSGSATIGARQGTDNVWGYPDSTDFADDFSTTPKTVLSIGSPFAILSRRRGRGGDVLHRNGWRIHAFGGDFDQCMECAEGLLVLPSGELGGKLIRPAGTGLVFPATPRELCTRIRTTRPARSSIPHLPHFPTTSGWLTQTTSEVTGPTGFHFCGGNGAEWRYKKALRGIIEIQRRTKNSKNISSLTYSGQNGPT
ncbi:MAG: hypothetical protein IPO35_17735 [Uliginosibacterium sp.]|nr:hypothetical protein [Uliginosibacterium sp.]